MAYVQDIFVKQLISHLAVVRASWELHTHCVWSGHHEESVRGDHECEEFECERFECGPHWRLKDDHAVVFFWRDAPGTYCVHGKPIYSHDELVRIRDESETVKTLFESGTFRVFLQRVNWRNHESRNSWGVQSDTELVITHRDEEKLRIDWHDRSWKRHITDALKRK